MDSHIEVIGVDHGWSGMKTVRKLQRNLHFITM